MIAIKDGIDMSGLASELWAVAEKIASLFERYGISAVITSARRPAATPFSYHHIGRALDWRAKSIHSEGAQLKILAEMKAVCGPDFDVLLHGDGDNIHYHVEYDPD